MGRIHTVGAICYTLPVVADGLKVGNICWIMFADFCGDYCGSVHDRFDKKAAVINILSVRLSFVIPYLLDLTDISTNRIMRWTMLYSINTGALTVSVTTVISTV